MWTRNLAALVLIIFGICLSPHQGLARAPAVERALQPVLSGYEVIRMKPSDIETQARQSSEPLELNLSGVRYYFELVPRDLRSPRYRAEVTGEDGVRQQLPPPPVTTYKGTAVVGQEVVQARFTITNDRFEGVVFTPGDWHYIEPLRNYLPSAEAAECTNQIVTRMAIIRASNNCFRWTSSLNWRPCTRNCLSAWNRRTIVEATNSWISLRNTWNFFSDYLPFRQGNTLNESGRELAALLCGNRRAMGFLNAFGLYKFTQQIASKAVMCHKSCSSILSEERLDQIPYRVHFEEGPASVQSFQIRKFGVVLFLLQMPQALVGALDALLERHGNTRLVQDLKRVTTMANSPGSVWGLLRPLVPADLRTGGGHRTLWQV